MDSKIQNELQQMKRDLLELSLKAIDLSKQLEVDYSESPEMRKAYKKGFGFNVKHSS